MTNPVITFSTIFRSTPVKNRQLTGRLMTKDKGKTNINLPQTGKMETDRCRAHTPAGTDGDVPKTPFLVIIE